MKATTQVFRVRRSVLLRFERPVFLEIGRASCRGRVEISVGAGSLKKKKKKPKSLQYNWRNRRTSTSSSSPRQLLRRPVDNHYLLKLPVRMCFSVSTHWPAHARHILHK